MPSKLPSNQFDHFYKGGNRIGKLRNGPGGPMRPEEWIGSTTTRFGEAVNGLLVVLACGKRSIHGQVLLVTASALEHHFTVVPPRHQAHLPLG